MKVSVIIPTYNRRELLLRAIQSVLDQESSAAEIIVVDDGSSDDTALAVQQSFPQVQLLCQQNRGVSAARNLGIAAASSPWIALLDSDDEWKPQKLAAQCARLHEDNALKLCHSDEIWIRNGKRVNPMNKHAKPQGRIFKQCLPLCCISPSSVVIHRSVFDDVGLFDESLLVCEDYDMWLRICSRYSVTLVPKPLVIKYGGHEDQLSRKFWGMDRFRVQALNKLLQNSKLSLEDRHAAIETLLSKCKILINGFTKRGKTQQVNHYQNLASKWQQEVEPC